MIETLKCKVSELKFDAEFLEMRPVNLFVVSQYRQAMRSGARFPRPIITEKHVIVSGAHRVTSYLEEYGEDHVIEVEVRKYDNRLDMLMDFARENVTNPMPLSKFSKQKIAVAALNKGATPEEIASLFCVSVRRIEEWAGQTVVVLGPKKSRATMPIKTGPDIVGETVREVQYQEHAHHDRGVSARQMMAQLLRWFENGWIKAEDAKSAEMAEDLRDALSAFLVEVKGRTA